MLVGSPGSQTSGDFGAAYVFTLSRGVWAASGQLRPSRQWRDLSISFGSAVALARNGALAVVGEPHTTVGSVGDTGSAYAYAYGNGAWSPATELAASHGASDREFGTAVAAAQSPTGAIALIGAPGILTPCPCLNPHNSAGVTYIFTKSGRGWVATGALRDPGNTSWDGFGTYLTLAPDANHALISAPFTYWWSTPAAVGRAYFYANIGGRWTLERQITNPHNDERDYFGGRMALSDTATTLFITAPGYPGDTGPAWEQGAVYVYG